MNKTIIRQLKPQMDAWMFRGKILILYGARQVGKTTLSKTFLEPLGNDGLYLNCEIQSINAALSVREPLALRRFLGDKKLIVLDEAQHIEGIGEVLKLLSDTFPEIQIIATGSSSFELAKRSSEPLTGRAVTFTLYPFSYSELSQVYNYAERNSAVDFWLRYGFYPDIVFASETDARILLDNLSSRYLYKDVLEFENIKHADILVRLLQLLALQIGQLVSYHELAKTLKISSPTVERYIDLLEKSFVIFRLPPFNRNLRNELGKKNKIYFYDLGIRNSIIQQFQPIDLRNDKGALWENFLIVERLKFIQSKTWRPNRYFWRTQQQAEIDYIEERDGMLDAYEFKWLDKSARVPLAFIKAYPDSTFKVVHRDNFESFITD